MTCKELSSVAPFGPQEDSGILSRDEPVTMFLAGFQGSKDLIGAEKTVSNLLADFPGSTLLIYDKLDPEDPNLEADLLRRGIEKLPHLIILKDEECNFSYCGSFDEAELSTELSRCFLPVHLSMPYQGKPCQSCLTLYQKLNHVPDSSYMLSFEPFATLVWHDEHPEGRPESVRHQQQCKVWMFNLQLARNYLWDHGVVAEKHKSFWEISQKLLPSWPGFKRLILNSHEMDSYRACVEEKEEIFDMMINGFNTEISYHCTGLGFVIKGFTCRPSEQSKE